jgi:ABC-type uncharacterized transport system involved in gliding motility auxiliary subunit
MQTEDGAATRSWGDGLTALLRRLNRPAADGLYALLLLTLVLLLGWLAARHEHSWDWTLSGRNSLSDESLAVLADLDEALDIRVYGAPGTPLARSIEQVLQRYRRASDRIRVDYIDPQLFPELARAAGVQLQGQLVLEYRDRRVSLARLDERALTNAIARLQLEDAPWIAVLEGHGERAIDGASGSDIGRFAQLLSQRGFRLQPLDLARQPSVPDNVDVLLITTPVINLFPGEAEALRAYLARGGNLLWLLDPPGANGLHGLEPLRDALGLTLLPGQVVDATAGDLRLEAPTFAVVEQWPQHPLTAALAQPAVLPGSVALALDPPSPWDLTLRLRTGARSWNETGPVRGEIARDPDADERSGPLDVALLLTRPLSAAPGFDPKRSEGDRQRPPRRGKPATQRIALVGDGDFIANAHLDEGANKALALQLTRWVAHRDDLVAIPAPEDDRVALVLTPLRLMLLSAGALILLPAALVLTGLGIHWYRTRA